MEIVINYSDVVGVSDTGLVHDTEIDCDVWVYEDGKATGYFPIRTLEQLEKWRTPPHSVELNGQLVI